jgi:hypothetical protein
MITSSPEGRFVHWKGMKLSDLLEAEERLVAHLEPLPFQEGRPLATVAEELTELVDASSDELISRQVLMAEEGEDDVDLPIVEFDAEEGGNPRQANHRPPPEDLCQRINEGRDARSVIDSRRRER